MGKSIREYLRELWESHGGGFYGFVAAVTFLYLEASDLIPELARIGQAEWFSIGWWITWFVGNMVEAITNGVYAAIWPATWINRFGVGVVTAVALGGSYLGYLAVRPTVLRLLRDPDEPVLEAATVTKRIE